MSSFPTLWQTFKKEATNINSIVSIIFFSFIFFSFSILTINYKLLIAILLGENSLNFKLTIIYQLLIGSYSALGNIDFLLVLLTSVLVGLNTLFLIKTLKGIHKERGKLSLTVGGSTILGVLVAGSCSCGFSILSILGLAGALTFIPFGGLGLHFIALILLVFSFIYSLNTYHRKIVCKIK